MKKNAILLSVTLLIILGASTAWAQTVIRSLPYTITESGSYALKDNLTSTGNGIIVGADHVTIDLGGHTISGSGVNYGISASNCYDVTVMNGTVTNFSYGIRTETSTSSIRIINVRVHNNSPQGIWLQGKDNLVKDCAVSFNSNIGMYVEGGTITGNVVFGNGNYGIQADYGCTVIGNTTNSNGKGIQAWRGTTVKNNTAYGNAATGIDLGGNNLVDGNTAYGNDTSGSGYPNMSPCATCTFGANNAP